MSLAANRRRAALLLCCALQGGPVEVDPAAVDAALQDYAAQRYEAAWRALSAEVQRCGERAPDEVRLDAALAALRAQRSRDAEQFLADVDADGPFAADQLLLLGHAAWLDAERAVAAARLPDAEPMAWLMAVRAITRAESAFRTAAELRPGFAIAVRNCERAQRRRQEMERERDAATPPDAKKEDAPKPEPVPPDPDQPPEQVQAEVAAGKLSADELQRLQQLVRTRQRQKVQVRQEAAPSADPGGRGW